jgi:hypothetical protein
MRQKVPSPSDIYFTDNHLISLEIFLARIPARLPWIGDRTVFGIYNEDLSVNEVRQEIG